MSSRIKSAGLMIIILGSAITIFAKGNKELEDALKAKYQVAQMALDHLRVVKEGTPLVLRQDGVYANPSTNIGALETKVRDGMVVPPGKFAASFVSEPSNKTLKAGTNVYATRISVSDKDVKIEIITADLVESSFRGTTRQQRFVATLAFELPPDLLASGDPSAVEKAIDPVLLAQADVQGAATKTVELGQTEDEVKAILGAPDKIIKLGAKDEFVYKDIKVIFMDGKVSDVQ